MRALATTGFKASLQPGIRSWPYDMQGRSFDPDDLFSSGVEGVWFDPSNYTTLFQDVNGTTPVTSVNQPIGLMLDTSKKLALGPELTPNDYLTNPATWIVTGGTATSEAGQIVFTASAAGQMVVKIVGSYTIDRVFKTSLRISQISTGRAVDRSIRGVGFGTTSSVGTLDCHPRGSSSTDLIVLSMNASVTGQSFSIDLLTIRELAGYHAFSPGSTVAEFPTLSARYNLLLYSERLDAYVWTGVSGATATATILTLPTASALHRQIFGSGSANAVVGQTFNVSFDIQKISGAATVLKVYIADGAIVDVQLPAEQQRVSVQVVAGATGAWIDIQADAGCVVYLSKIQVVPSDQSNVAYQRVNTTIDYDSIGFPRYISFNGTNQSMRTPPIDFQYTDKMFVSTAVRKLNSTPSVVVELSTSVDSNVNAFNLYSDTWGTNTWYVASGASAQGQLYTVSTPFAAPITNILSVSLDRSILDNSQISVRADGQQPTTNYSGTASNGNYGNYALYFGARAGSSDWFKGSLYGVVIAGKRASEKQILWTEKELREKVGR